MLWDFPKYTLVASAQGVRYHCAIYEIGSKYHYFILDWEDLGYTDIVETCILFGVTYYLSSAYSMCEMYERELTEADMILAYEE